MRVICQSVSWSSRLFDTVVPVIFHDWVDITKGINPLSTSLLEFLSLSHRVRQGAQGSWISILNFTSLSNWWVFADGWIDIRHWKSSNWKLCAWRVRRVQLFSFDFGSEIFYRGRESKPFPQPAQARGWTKIVGEGRNTRGRIYFQFFYHRCKYFFSINY